MPGKHPSSTGAYPATALVDWPPELVDATPGLISGSPRSNLNSKAPICQRSVACRGLPLPASLARDAAIVKPAQLRNLSCSRSPRLSCAPPPRNTALGSSLDQLHPASRTTSSRAPLANHQPRRQRQPTALKRKRRGDVSMSQTRANRGPALWREAAQGTQKGELLGGMARCAGKMPGSVLFLFCFCLPSYHLLPTSSFGHFFFYTTSICLISPFPCPWQDDLLSGLMRWPPHRPVDVAKATQLRASALSWASHS